MILEIRMHDGSIIHENTNSYNPLETQQVINDNSNIGNMITIGRALISRHTIKLIRPIDEETIVVPVPPTEGEIQ